MNCSQKAFSTPKNKYLSPVNNKAQTEHAITMYKTIQSSNILLVEGTEKILNAALMGNGNLSALLEVIVPDKWSEFGNIILQYSLERVLSDPSEAMWWTWFPIHKEARTLIGSCGYKGKPENGMVEIGYEVIESYRNKGYATEIAKALLDFAFEHKAVNVVQAHTLAEKNASGSILTKCGLKWVGELEDEEDGTIWKWRISRFEYENG